MASLYQRFTGKINTGSSFPVPPEASRLLGQGEQPAEIPQRGLIHQRCEDEDVRLFSLPLRKPLKMSAVGIKLLMLLKLSNFQVAASVI